MKGLRWFCINIVLAIAIGTFLNFALLERGIPLLICYAVGFCLGILAALSDKW